MNNLFFKPFCLLLLITTALTASASFIDFTVDGIRYQSLRLSTGENNANVIGYVEQTLSSGDVFIPETVTYDSVLYTVNYINDGAFYEKKHLKSVSIPNSIFRIGDEAFYGCSALMNIDIPNSVKVIGDGAFAECSSLSNATLPNDVFYIGRGAFYLCSNLTRVIIPSSVTEIGVAAFIGCSGLTNVTCLAIKPPKNENSVSFDSITYSNIPLFIPYKSLSAYKNAEGWKSFVNIRVLGDLDLDGELGINDLSDLIDIILTGTVTIEEIPAADINGDGTISIADITELIDQLLNVGF